MGRGHPVKPAHDEPGVRKPPGLLGCIRERRAESGYLGLRVLAWAFTDWWEARPRLRKCVRWGLPLAVVLCAAGIWFIPRWYRRNTVRLAEDWLRSGKLSYAADAIRQAIATNPDDPNTWRVAAAFARRVGRLPAALDYSRRAAKLDPSSETLQLDFAADALVAGQTAEATAALGQLTPAQRAASGRAQRIEGEIDLREMRLTDACNAFRASIRLEGPAATNETPLGSILLAATSPAERAQGLALLHKWTSSPVAGANALRALLADAAQRDDKADMERYAFKLVHHPACLISDIPKCLYALSHSDEAAYQTTLGELETVHRATPQKAALLIGWLNQIGRSDSALTFADSLPQAMRSAPPVAPSVFEAFRLRSEWGRLLQASEAESWPEDTDFMRLAYGTLAASHVGDARTEAKDWHDLREHCEIKASHALFVADTLYTWGLKDRAVELLWMAAKTPATERLALETLARHYQVMRNAEGQYRVFSRLYSEHPDDPDIANNFAYFAALAGHEAPLALDIARRNHEQHPDSVAYTSTYAFILAHQMHTASAIELLRPLKGDVEKDPGLRYTYAIVLAEMGRKDEARAMARGLDPSHLTVAEDTLLKQLLSEDILPY